MTKSKKIGADFPHDDCYQFRQAVEDPTCPLVYRSFDRSFFIESREHAPVTKWRYCPWCAFELPENLRGEWWDELEKIGVNDLFELDFDKLPDALKSDVWWKSKGL